MDGGSSTKTNLLRRAVNTITLNPMWLNFQETRNPFCQNETLYPCVANVLIFIL
jgi:hypothetical protein